MLCLFHEMNKTKNLLAFQVELMSKIFQNEINYVLKVKYEAFNF